METEIERHCLRYVIEHWWDDLDSADWVTRTCARNRLHGAFIVASDELSEELKLLHNVACQREVEFKEQP